MSDVNNPFGILYGFFVHLMGLCASIYEWLTTDYTILGYTFKPLYITGAVLLVLITARIVKEFVPVA